MAMVRLGLRNRSRLGGGGLCVPPRQPGAPGRHHSKRHAVALFNYLFAAIYRDEPEEVAGMVLISTLLALLWLPLLVAVLT